MKFRALFSSLIMLCIGLGGVLFSQDLVKLQKEEEKRRKKIKKSVLKVTDDNIHKLAKKSKAKINKLPGKGRQVQPLNKSDEGKEADKKNNTKNREYWQSEKRRIESRIKFYQKAIKQLTLKVNKLHTDHLIMDLHIQKMQIKKELDKTNAELNKSKKELTFYQNELAALHERGRRAGIPPGWLR